MIFSGKNQHNLSPLYEQDAPKSLSLYYSYSTNNIPTSSLMSSKCLMTFSEHILGRMSLLFLFRRVCVRLAPGMSLSQKGKCQGTHPFVGFLIQSAHRQQYSRPDTSSTSFPETYLTSKVIPGCCTPDDMGITGHASPTN